MPASLQLTKFKDVALEDVFFDSLKAQYKEFPIWFAKKSEDPVYIVKDDHDKLRGFVYLKIEEGAIVDVDPPLPPAKRIKVGTLKINAHGTKLGERVIKKIFDHAFAEDAQEIYVTVFDTHASLIKLFKKYGFEQKGSKITANGEEIVLVRSLSEMKEDIIKDYPFIHTYGVNVFLLAIYPKFHTDLFPDSMLNTERGHIVEDVSHTNTIHKVYVAKLTLTQMKKGDVVVIYRATDIKGRARFRSVATSICVVEETKSRRDFADEDDFVKYTSPHSVFSEEELKDWYKDKKRRLFVIKMTYNAALPKRPIRDVLMGDVGIPEQPRWDIKRLTHDHLNRISELAELNGRLIVE